MLSLNDIINASFKKSGFSGYRTDEVDHFIDQVKESYDSLMKKNLEQKEEYERLKAENSQLLEKMKILAEKIESYRAEEDEIKNALVSAQKLGDASIRESRHKAEIIIKDANIKAERIITAAKNEVIGEQNELERLQKTVSDFRSKLLSAYKEHLTMIDALPVQKPEVKIAEEPVQPKTVVPQEISPAVEEPKPQEFSVSAESVSAETEEDEPVDPVFRAEVSGFDAMKPTEPVENRYSAIQFSNGYDISDDQNAPDGILH